MATSLLHSGTPCLIHTDEHVAIWASTLRALRTLRHLGHLPTLQECGHSALTCRFRIHHSILDIPEIADCTLSREVSFGRVADKYRQAFQTQSFLSIETSFVSATSRSGLVPLGFRHGSLARSCSGLVPPCFRHGSLAHSNRKNPERSLRAHVTLEFLEFDLGSGRLRLNRRLQAQPPGVPAEPDI